MTRNKVLATVGDREITIQDVEHLLRNLGPQRGAQFNSAEGRQRLLEELIVQEMFYLDAIKNKLDQEKAYEVEVERMKVDVLKQYAVKRIFDDIVVTEEEAFNHFKENRNEYKAPEKIRAKHILVEESQQAEQIYLDLKKGLFFEEAAKKYSKCPSAANGGDLNYFTKGQMVPEFDTAVFGMAVNEISRPVKTQFGYHIIKLVDKKKAGLSDFEDVKGQIMEQLVGAKQNQTYMDETKRLKGQYPVKRN